MTDAMITLDAAALEELRGRTFLPGPVTTNQLIQQSRAALNLRDKLASCERERDELIALVGISPDEMPSDRGTMIARWLMAWFKASGAQNFVSVDFRDDQTEEWYVIAAHKREGMSPGKMLEHAGRESRQSNTVGR